jgi:hypothetical protein
MHIQKNMWWQFAKDPTENGCCCLQESVKFHAQFLKMTSLMLPHDQLHGNTCIAHLSQMDQCDAPAQKKK